jgi:hypothetical protein
MVKWIEPWIGVDLDSTLANGNSKGYEIGEPIPKMVERIKQWRKEGEDVRIVTARCDGNTRASTKEELESFGIDDSWNVITQINEIERWCLQHIGEVLPVTDRKDCGMTHLYDDKAIRVNKDTGELCTGCRHHLMGVESHPLLSEDYYEIEEIGGGIISVVYKALNIRGKVIALKGVRDKWHNDKTVLDQFEIECKAQDLVSPIPNLSSLRKMHKGYMELDYIVGATNLEDIIKSGKKFKLNDCWFELRELSGALDEIHNMGVYHCDIKPRNILFEYGKYIKLIDFGIAQLSDEENYFDVSKFWGTVKNYIAPEIAAGQRATAKSDQYMFAVTIYEMLTGFRPGDHPTCSSREFAKAFGKAFAKSPDDRYKNCVEFMNALKEFC